MAETDPQPASRIFISYRREDSAGHVLALLPSLRRHFGADRIFKDTDNIPPGADFFKFIKRELESCSVLLAIIGREWLNIRDSRLKSRRLDNPDDYLRVEVASALKNERIRVIPVLIERASMPAADDLPPDLAALSGRNAVELSDGRWDSDVQLLIQAVERARAEAVVRPDPTVQRPELLELHRRRAREIAAHLAAAREAFEARDCEATLWACEQALVIDPQRSDALELLDRARKALDEQKIETWLREAREALGKGDAGAASDLIDQALAIDSTLEAALTLRQEMLELRRERERERERARAVRAATGRAQASLDDGDFEAAVRHAEDALGADPDAADAQNIRSQALAALDERRRQREHKKRAQQAVTDARARLAAGEHDAALGLLREFSPPHDLVVQALREVEEQVDTIKHRRQEVDELIGAASDLLTAGRFQEAIVRLSEAAAIESDRPELAGLLQEAQARQAAVAAAERARQSAEARLAEASEKFHRQDYAAARALVEAARGDAPDHPQVAPWLRRIEAAVAEQASAARRRQAIAASLDDAQTSFTKGDLEATIRHADAALALDPTLEEAQALRRTARATLAERQARDEHERLARQTVERARGMFEANEHKDAVSLLEAFHPPHALVSDALHQLQQRLRQLEQQRREEQEQAARRQQEMERASAERKRADAIRDILARGQAHLDGEDFVAAVSDADELLRIDPDSVRGRVLRAAATERLQLRSQREQREQEAREAAEKARTEAARAAEQQRQAEARERQERERVAREAAEKAHADAVRVEAERRQAEARERELAEASSRQAARQARTDQLLAEAQSALGAKAFRIAKRKAQAVLGLSHDNEAARTLLSSATLELRAARRRFWSDLRLPAVAGAAVAIIGTTTGVWYYTQRSAPRPQGDVDTIVTNPVSSPKADPGGRAPAEATSSGAPGPASPSITQPVPPTVAEEARQPQLEQLREAAGRQLRTGQRAPALDAAVRGLQLEPNDAALQSVVDSLLGDAASRAQRAKTRASTANAVTLAPGTFSQAVTLEDEATRSRAAGAKAMAIQSLWKAAKLFDLSAGQAATEQARLDEDRARQRQRAEDEARRKQLAEQTDARRPPAGPSGEDTAVRARPPVDAAPIQTESPKPPVDRTDEEKARIQQTLQRYEAAYDNLNAAAVKQVYPGAPESLARAFGQYEFYRLEMFIEKVDLAPGATTATAVCRLSHFFQPRVGRSQQEVRKQEFQLQKQGDSWIIVRIQAR